MWNNKGPETEPWGTLYVINEPYLWDQIIFFLQVVSSNWQASNFEVESNVEERNVQFLLQPLGSGSNMELVSVNLRVKMTNFIADKHI